MFIGIEKKNWADMNNSFLETYFIRRPDGDSNSVELWSVQRLPFEPKGDLLKMRNSLRMAIKSLKSGSDTILNAIYTSDQNESFDAENVLIYNVGSSVFGHLCGKGLRFERRILPPPEAPVPLMKPAVHYHFYSVISREEKSHYWKKEMSLAQWADIPCITLRSDSKPHSIWYAMKNSKAEVNNGHPAPSPYGIQVIIKTPKNTKINLASVVKPLLDGIISSFHTHDGSDVSEITARLAEILGENESRIEGMLTDSQMNVLGTRNLVHRFGQGLQWNPADDTCMTAEILLDDSMENAVWSLSGEMYTIEPSKK